MLIYNIMFTTAYKVLKIIKEIYNFIYKILIKLL